MSITRELELIDRSAAIEAVKNDLDWLGSRDGPAAVSALQRLHVYSTADYKHLTEEHEQAVLHCAVEEIRKEYDYHKGILDKTDGLCASRRGICEGLSRALTIIAQTMQRASAAGGGIPEEEVCACQKQE